ncbi:hypothetical protein AB1Y20_003183 [Prymnesium parvum]|uniref:Uncharacterized protein n=1 Tax=Prymnesium parvum TaxID=97485 RepID=A0AB34JA27_PRYPA
MPAPSTTSHAIYRQGVRASPNAPLCATPPGTASARRCALTQLSLSSVSPAPQLTNLTNEQYSSPSLLHQLSGTPSPRRRESPSLHSKVAVAGHLVDVHLYDRLRADGYGWAGKLDENLRSAESPAAEYRVGPLAVDHTDEHAMSAGLDTQAKVPSPTGRSVPRCVVELMLPEVSALRP